MAGPKGDGSYFVNVFWMMEVTLVLETPPKCVDLALEDELLPRLNHVF